MKWVHLTTAQNQLEAEMWRDLLVSSGIPALVRPGDTASFLGVRAYPCRVMVLEDQAEEARKFLEDQIGHELA